MRPPGVLKFIEDCFWTVLYIGGIAILLKTLFYAGGLAVCKNLERLDLFAKKLRSSLAGLIIIVIIILVLRFPG